MHTNFQFDKKSFVRDWIKELESGKYQQTANYLRADDAYCCLGIACQLFGQRTSTCAFNDNEKLIYFDEGDVCEEDSELPEFIAKKLGTVAGGSIRFGNKVLGLADMNDNGISFKGIAALLRIYPLTSTGTVLLSPWATTYPSLTTADSLRKNLQKIFARTKLSKTWEKVAIRPGSKIDKLLGLGANS